MNRLTLHITNGSFVAHLETVLVTQAAMHNSMHVLNFGDTVYLQVISVDSRRLVGGFLNGGMELMISPTHGISHFLLATILAMNGFCGVLRCQSLPYI